MLLDDAISTRRSIRKYKAQDVNDRDIEKLLEAARQTPSGKNRQPWYFYVMRGEERMRLADELYRVAIRTDNRGAAATAEIIRSAPVFIAAYMQSTEITSDVLSMGAAIYAICLKATDLALGSLWIGDTDILSDIPLYREMVGGVAVGYAAEYPSPRPRKSLEEISNLTKQEKTQNASDTFVRVSIESERYAFVSYSHLDTDAVVEDIVELKKHGVPLWYDREMEKGKAWDGQALSFIENPNCKVFIFYASHSSLRSEAVCCEFCAARERVSRDEDFYFLPVLLGEDSTATLIEGLREDGYDKYADIYSSYFTLENKVLYVERSVIPAAKKHIEELLLFLTGKSIIADPSIYDSFVYAIREGKCVITGYCGENAHIVIPEEISGYPVCEIGESAFANNKKLRTVTLPASLRRLSLGVFRNSGLERIEIPYGVTEIDTACFRDCADLKEITLPPHITYVAEALFRGCASLESITVPEGVTELREAAFRSCTSLKTAYMPNTLRRMTEGGFWGCSSLRTLIIPEDVEGVEAQSFDTSVNLDEVRIGQFIFKHGTVTEFR